MAAIDQIAAGEPAAAGRGLRRGGQGGTRSGQREGSGPGGG